MVLHVEQAALLRLRPMELHKLLVYMGRHSDLGRPRGSFTASNCSSAGYVEPPPTLSYPFLPFRGGFSRPPEILNLA